MLLHFLWVRVLDFFGRYPNLNAKFSEFLIKIYDTKMIFDSQTMGLIPIWTGNSKKKLTIEDLFRFIEDFDFLSPLGVDEYNERFEILFVFAREFFESDFFT